MSAIETKALETLQKNMLYFKKKQIRLYDKLQLLEKAIETEVYQEKYALEYMDGYFDILELSSNSYLYSTNSLQYSKNLTSGYNHRRTGAIYEALRRVELDQNAANIIDISELSFHNALWATAKLIRYSYDYADKQTTSMNTVNKLIFLGVGLGLHLNQFKQKYKPKVLFIQEDNLELFRLSLFVTDYSSLSKRSILYFSIMDEINEYKKEFISFSDEAYNYNLYIKHIPFLENYEEKLKLLQQFTLEQNHIIYPYSAYLLRYSNAPRYLAKGESFLNVNTMYTETIFSDKPVIFVASGPSTGKYLQWLKDNSEKFIFVAPLSTCKLLAKHNIPVDVMLHIDPGEDSTAKLFDDFEYAKYFEKTLIIFASNIDEVTVNRFKNNKIYFIEQATHYKKNFGNLTAPTVGEYTYALLLILGVENLYLLGMDLALDSTTLQSHSGEHPFANEQEMIRASQKNKTALDVESDIIYVKGNFDEKVPTIATYNISINEFKRYSGMVHKREQKVYNLSHGAYLEKTIPIAVKDIDSTSLTNINKNDLYIQLIKFFNTISSNEFREEDKEIIRYQIAEAKKLQFRFLQHKGKKFIDIEKYTSAISELSHDLSDMTNTSKSDLAEVYYNFFKISLPYIFDIFNTQELKEPNKRIKEIDAILMHQLEKMSDHFITKMDAYLIISK